MTFRTILSALAILALAPTPAFGGAPFIGTDSVPPPLVPYEATTADRWVFSAAAGATVEAQLVWTDPDADLSLELTPQEFVCADAQCFTQVTGYAGCGQMDIGLPGNDAQTRSVRYTVQQAGPAKLLVRAEFALEAVPYELSILVDGEAPASVHLENDRSTTHHRHHVCRLS